MATQALTGSRVRQRRLALGLRQADLARDVAISASYLNLIEHDRRRIGPELLTRLSQALGIDEAALALGAENALIEDLRAAAAEVAAAEGEPSAEIARIDEFMARFPGWAGVLAQAHQRCERLEQAVAALNDRIANDPHLSQALHEVLSAVSAVRSTAAILAESEDIEPEWRARFHHNLHGDSERLAAGAEALVAYLDRFDQAAEAGVASPQEEVDGWLAARGWHLAELEAGEDMAKAVAGLASGAARALAQSWVTQATADVAALPLARFQAALARLGPESGPPESGPPDPAALATAFGAPILTVMRRLATLPGAVAGLVICDGSGTLIFRKPVAGFAPPRFGAACALWPLYAALGRPMTPITARIATEGRSGQRFRVQAFCQPRYPQGFGGPELREAAMLVWPDGGDEAGEVLAVGSTCRICPQAACPARREPSIILTVAAGAIGF